MPTPTPSTRKDLFAGTPTRADWARRSMPAPVGGPQTEMDRAVAQLGPSINYPDGRVTDRRSGVVIAYPRDWPRYSPVSVEGDGVD